MDTRVPNFEAFFESETQARWAEAATLIDQYAMPAIQAVINPQIQVLPGAGGRTFSMVKDLPRGIAGRANGPDVTRISDWVLSSEILSGSLSHTLVDSHAGYVASVANHELAHGADAAQASWGWGMMGVNPWFTEGLAKNVEETAARMAMGLEWGARSHGLPPNTLRGSLMSAWPGSYGATGPAFGEGVEPACG